MPELSTESVLNTGIRDNHAHRDHGCLVRHRVKRPIHQHENLNGIRLLYIQ